MLVVHREAKSAPMTWGDGDWAIYPADTRIGNRYIKFFHCVFILIVILDYLPSFS